MKRILLLLITTLCLSCTSNESSNDFNHGWMFCMGEMDSELYNTSANDSDSWREVRIPHDWSIESGYTPDNTAGSNGFLPGGVGWYQKKFSLPSEDIGKNIYVRFEGVYNNAQVWINGHDLGYFPNGYLDFEYELTKYLKESGNTLTVRVDRRAYADARWYAGAGIYRPVHLIVRNNIYIPTHAQQISATNVTKESADVNTKTKIKNCSDKEQSFTIQYNLMFDGKSIEEISSEQKIAANGEITLNEEFKITQPTLWGIDNPARYELRTQIMQGETKIDDRSEYFGVKNAIFDPQRGFLLNGKEVKIKGVNIHHDLGCLGVALYDKALCRRLKKMQDMGVNAIRTAHNPHSESLLTMCDTMGLLVMNEFVDEWLEVKDKWIEQRSKSGIADSLQTGYTKHFKERAEQDLKAFVRRDYNHPSIILWSIGNEIEWTYPYYFASVAKTAGYKGLVYTGDNRAESEKAIATKFKELSKGDDKLAQTAQQLVEWIKEVDTTRPVTSGVVIPAVSRISGYTDALDVIGYNYKDTSYEFDHQRYPDKSIIGSENVGQYFEWKAVEDKPYIPGIFLWTGVDYIGENGPWPAKGGHYSLFDFAGFKSSRGEFFETLWSDKPKTHMVTTPASMSEFQLCKDGSFEVVLRKDPLRRWLWYETFDKWSYPLREQVVVQIYTNSPKAELRLNGRSLGVKSRADFATENIIVWQIPYVPGELKAVGLSEDGKVESQCTLRTPGDISQINATIDNYAIISDGRDLVNIEVELQDSKGTRVCDTPQELTIECDSKSLILGVDNGSDTFVGDHQSNKIITHNGRALIVMQPKNGAGGESKVTISTESGVKSFVTLNYIAK